MKIPSLALCLVFAAATLAAALWLRALIAVGAVRQLSFGVGALLGLLPFAVVIAAFYFQLAQHSASWRVESAAWVFVWVSFYPALVGGSLGHLFRRLPLKHALQPVAQADA